MAAVEKLPPELQNLIFDFIHCPDDLRCLCLTNRHCQELALPRLYHDVTIDLHKCYSGPDGILSPVNPGLKYIRILEFVPQKPRLIDSPWLIIRIALQTLAEHNLEALYLPCELAVSYDWLLLLATRQHRLKTLSMGRCGTLLSKALASPSWSAQSLVRLEKLQMPELLSNVHDLEGYNQLIKRSGLLLKDLKLNTHSIIDEELAADVGAVEPLHDEDGTDGILTKTLFSHIAPFGDASALCLKSLNLDRIDLTWAAKNYMQVIAFERLCSMVLHDCSGSSIFLRALLEQRENPALDLKEFTYFGERLEASTIKGLVMSCTGLTRLEFEFKEVAQELPDLNCLHRHSSSMRELSISRYENGHAAGLTLEEVKAIGQLGQLRQLAVGLPEARVACFPKREEDEFRQSLTLLSRLPNLRGLRVFSWPAACAGCFFADIDLPPANPEVESRLVRAGNEHYQNDLQVFASMCFDTMALDRANGCVPLTVDGLPALCFGNGVDGDCVMEEEGRVSQAMDPLLYVPVKETDQTGFVRISALARFRVDFKWMDPQCGYMYQD